MRWTWDPRKDEINRQKHRIGFATAVLVFDDPLAATKLDEYAHEERWQTIGMIDPQTIIVIHTVSEHHGTPGRIISARKATARERKIYEEGNF